MTAPEAQCFVVNVRAIVTWLLVIWFVALGGLVASAIFASIRSMRERKDKNR